MSISMVSSSSGRFTPIITENWQRIMEKNIPDLFEYISQHGSPLHLIHLSEFRNNIDNIVRVLNLKNVSFKIFYGAKVNKSTALIKEASLSGIGVDISSLYEFNDAISSGHKPENIIATGPVKSSKFLSCLINRQVLISIDSESEYRTLKSLLAKRAMVNYPILLRLKPDFEKNNRFGMPKFKVIEIISDIVSNKTFKLLGFHFHLNGYNLESRIMAFKEVVSLVSISKNFGLDISIIDIGGGLPAQYIDCNNYGRILKEISAHHFQNKKVPTSYYPYAGDMCASKWLDFLMDAYLDEGLQMKDWLRLNNLTIALEPGRALVNLACITIFKIARVKQLTSDLYVVFVEGSSFNACETWFNSEFLVDPILISKSLGESEGGKFLAYIAGHSCLSEDVITNRILEFSVLPKEEDLIIFTNTGGYQMDLLENEFHRYPMPKRLVIDGNLSKAFVEN